MRIDGPNKRVLWKFFHNVEAVLNRVHDAIENLDIQLVFVGESIELTELLEPLGLQDGGRAGTNNGN